MTPLLLGAVIVILVVAGVAVAVSVFHLRAYAVPWLLLVGPAGAGKTALVSAARKAAVPGKGWFDIAWQYIATQRGLSVSRLANGVVIDVAGGVAFPPDGADLTAWRRLLHVLTRYRPRRPVDGVILAIPAPLLLGGRLRAQNLAAAIRERLTEAQGRFGFSLPVYVLVTQCDTVRGFSAFAQAVPGLRHNMLGWSNDHAALALNDALAGDLKALNELAFKGEWITEGFGSLQQRIVQAQVEVFASSGPLDDAPDLFLFSGEVGRLAHPLRALLETAFEPSLYHESFFLRGFYLCGEGSPPGLVDDVLGDTSPSLHAVPANAVIFIDDLFDRKVFPERGLAIPLPEVAVSRLRRRLAGQVISGLLVVGLAVGTAYSYRRLREVHGTYTQALAMGSSLREQRRPRLSNGRAPTETELQERLAGSRDFLDRLQGIRRQNRFIEILDGIVTKIFMPASVPMELKVSREVKRVFNEVVLADIRAGLERRAREWLADATFPPGDRQGPLAPPLQDTAPYQALDRFAKTYQRFADNYQRYDTLRRGAGAGDPSALSELFAYLNSPLSPRAVDVAGDGKPQPFTLSPVLAGAVKAARAVSIDCAVFEVDATSRRSLVGLRASELLREFRDRSFGDISPVVTAANDFEADWKEASEQTGDRTVTEILESLIEDTTKLSGGVTAIGGPSKGLPIPVFESPPFKRPQVLATDEVCAALSPDLSADIREVEKLRDEHIDRLLEVEVEPFGPLIEEGEKGLALTKDVASLKEGLDNLQREGFWPPQLPDMSGGLPRNPAWRPEAIDDVVKVFDAFQSFSSRAFSRLSSQDRDAVLGLVEAEVAQLLATRLALTATPSDARPGREEVTRLGAQLAKMERPLVVLLEGEPDFGSAIVGTLDDQASRALAFIESEASKGYFFSRRDEMFEVWKGIESKSAIASSDGAVPAAEAADARARWARVVDEQLEGTRQLANQARPIVSYLAARRKSALVERWQGIVAGVADYDQKRPDSGLAALDNAMRDGVPAMVLTKDCSPGGNNGGLSGATGFFAAVRQDIVAEGVRRCRAGAQDRYLTIAAAFNRLLSARFPFSRGLDGTPEATLDQAAEFLRVYEATGGRSLRQPLQVLSCSEDAVRFIQRMDNASALLAAVVPSPQGSRALAAPAVVLDVVPTEFRVARDRENGGDQIVQWQMDVGRQTFRERELVQAKAAPWTFGDPVSVTLRFARDSPSRPLASAHFARGEDRSVRFEFRGTWALFGLLRSGRAVAEGLGLRDAAPTVLGFEIPVERDPTQLPLVGGRSESPFRVYMRLRVSQPGKTDALPLDEFPAEAPLRVSCPGVPR